MKFFQTVFILFSIALITSCSSDEEEVGHPREDIFGNYTSIYFDTLPNVSFPNQEGVYVKPYIEGELEVFLSERLDSLNFTKGSHYINEFGWQQELLFRSPSEDTQIVDPAIIYEDNGLFTWARWTNDFSNLIANDGSVITIETYEDDLILIQPSGIDTLPSIKQYFLKD